MSAISTEKLREVLASADAEEEAMEGDDYAFDWLTENAPALAAEVIRLREAQEQMHAALAPFAAFAERAERFIDEAAKSGGPAALSTSHFKLADFRRARAALSQKEEANG